MKEYRQALGENRIRPNFPLIPKQSLPLTQLREELPRGTKTSTVSRVKSKLNFQFYENFFNQEVF